MNELKKKYKNEIHELVKASHRIALEGFVTSQGGNLSYKVAEDIILITPTKLPKAEIEFDDIVIINHKGVVLHASNGRKPTGEAPFHTRIYRKRPDLNSLVHAHPPEITGLSIAHSNLLARPLLPEPIIEVGPVLQVEYKEPISEELAKAFDPVVLKSNAFIMLNHGILLGSVDSIIRAVELLEMIEATAKSARIAHSLGKVAEISKDEVKNLDNTIKTRSLAMPGAPGVNKSLVDLYFGETTQKKHRSF